MKGKLVKFDLTREDIPPLEGHDWSQETPYAASMAHENGRYRAYERCGYRPLPVWWPYLRCW